MANYYGVGRTNYFAVKSAEDFTAEMANYPVEVITREGEDGVTLYGLMDADSDGGGWNWSYVAELEAEDGEPVETDLEIDWVEVFARHLADGWVAILMETGAEKYRYVSGYALAVNSKGESHEINLSRDIAKLALTLGENVTDASY
jgi:hypothetical protein